MDTGSFCAEVCIKAVYIYFK